MFTERETERQTDRGGGSTRRLNNPFSCLRNVTSSPPTPTHALQVLSRVALGRRASEATRQSSWKVACESDRLSTREGSVCGSARPITVNCESDQDTVFPLVSSGQTLTQTNHRRWCLSSAVFGYRPWRLFCSWCLLVLHKRPYKLLWCLLAKP